MKKSEIKVLVNSDIKKKITLTREQLINILRDKFPQIAHTASITHYLDYYYEDFEIDELSVTWSEYETTETTEVIEDI